MEDGWRIKIWWQPNQLAQSLGRPRVVVRAQQLKHLENLAHWCNSCTVLKHLLITTIVAVLLVGCGTPRLVTIHTSVQTGDIIAVKQYLADGADVNAKGVSEWTPLHSEGCGYKFERERTDSFEYINYHRSCGNCSATS